MSTSKEEQEVQSVIDKQDLEMGRVFLWGDISEESIHIAIRQMRYIFFANKNKRIYIYIHSDGGEWEAAFAMVDEIKGLQRLGATVYTIALGKAYSSGAMILSAGTESYATLNTTLMLHPMSYGPGCDYVDQQSNYADFTKKLYLDGMTVVAKNCGYKSKGDFEIFLSAIKDGLWMTAKEATDFGLIWGIWDYKWERDITGLE